MKNIFTLYDNNVFEDDFDGFLFDDVFDMLDNLDGDFVAIVDLGRWNGRFNSCKDLGWYISDIRESLLGDCPKIFVEDGDLKIVDSHHDGTNYITIRRWRNNISDEKREETIYNIIYENLDEHSVNNVTAKLGKNVMKLVA